MEPQTDLLDSTMPQWEKVYTTRTFGRYISDVHLRVIMMAQAAAGSPGKGFEVGCEGGRWTRMLADLGWQMTCTEVNAGALEVCRRRVPNANLLLVRGEDT